MPARRLRQDLNKMVKNADGVPATEVADAIEGKPSWVERLGSKNMKVQQEEVGKSTQEKKGRRRS